MSEYVVDFGNDGKSAVRIAMARQHGAELREGIVRCRDCKFGYDVIWPTWADIPKDYLDCQGQLVETWDYYNDCTKDNPVKPDGFCAWGERRDE